MSVIINKNLLSYTELMNLEMSNLLLLCSGFLGCLLAFLVHNWYPAKVFMGDTGSLAIGGFIATILTLSQMYLFILVVGIMFVLNTLSVIIQVGYYKLTKKRVFKMAPLHHHFERCGIAETRVVFSYMVITIVGIAVAMLIYL